MIILLRHNEQNESEMIQKTQNIEDKTIRREAEAKKIKEELRYLKALNEQVNEKRGSILADRDTLVMAAEKIISANKDLQKEIDDILKHDEAIKKSLEIRDRKLSPVIH